MAIVPDLSGTRPGRPGNVPIKDPRNRSYRERTALDDAYSSEIQVELIAGSQVVLTEDNTRNMVLFITNEDAEVVYITTNNLSAAAGVPVYPAIGLQLKGKAAEQTYYCWGANNVTLTILEG